MKEGWNRMTLGEIATKMADGPFGSNLKAAHYTDKKEVRIIQLSNIGEDGWREDNTKYTTFSHLETISRSEVFPNDIVIAKMMPAGRAIICPNKEKKYVLSSDAVKVCLKDGYNSRFICFQINSAPFREQVYENVSGSGRVRTSLTKLRDCFLCIPPLPEQQRIVEYLDSTFAEIDALKAKAAEEVANAKAMFDAALKEEMTPKEGWEERSLKEIGKTQTGTTPSKNDPENYGNFIPFVRPAELNFDNCGGIDYNTDVMLSEKGLKNGRVFEAESILMCCIGSVGKTGFTNRRISCNQQINVLTPSAIYCSRFIFFALISPHFQEKVIKIAKSAQATLPIINKGKWEQLAIYVPSLTIQQAIVARLDTLRTLVTSLEQKYAKIAAECDALKQAILKETFE